MQTESYNIWTKFFECSCHTEGIFLSEECEGTVSLAFFRNGFKGRILNLRDRIRFCWQILRTGIPYADEVMLYQENAKKLGEALIEFANKEIKE
jgi:hypothetical protein